MFTTLLQSFSFQSFTGRPTCLKEGSGSTLSAIVIELARQNEGKKSYLIVNFVTYVCFITSFPPGCQLTH